MKNDVLGVFLRWYCQSLTEFNFWFRVPSFEAPYILFLSELAQDP
jgi:hypothetical protein